MSFRYIQAFLFSTIIFSAFLVLPSTPSASAVTVRSQAELSFQIRGNYRTYVSGQGLYLAGSLGAAGERKIWVESNMNRPNDTWKMLAQPYFGKTDQYGRFRLAIQAPSMFNISYRVRSEEYATPGVLFNAKTQDLDLYVDGVDQPDYARPVQPVENQSFTIVADTTADFYRRPTTDNLPTFVGREVTLLKRATPRKWETVATGKTDSTGQVRFTGLQELAGDYVYRVRQEEWTREGSEIGWIASWPIEVHVRKLLELPRYEPEGERTPGNVAGQRAPEAPNANAGARFGWYPVRWDFAWERGQSLDSPPTRGTDMVGRWREESSGLGRVVKHNGGLLVSSGKLVYDGRGDYGTTSAYVKRATATYGRWEATTALALAEKKFADYDVVVELIPARAKDYDCGRNNIVIAKWTGLDRAMTMAAYRGQRQWVKTIPSQGPGYSIPIVAAEVAKNHITWFLNGKPVGVVKNAKAIANVPRTLRLSLVGDQREHNNTSLFSDWQRAYPLSGGRQTTVAPALKASKLAACPG